jgi:penicillin-insensitive murein endopeptidase
MRVRRLAGVVAVAAFAAAFSMTGLMIAPIRAAEIVDWGQLTDPSAGPAHVFGGHARGCLAGATALPLQGDGFEVMRPSRNRYYGHPELIAFIQNFARTMRQYGWSGLLIGDLAQPRGGPMRSGHRSHQTGLDVDIWFLPAPPQPLSAEERETLSAVSMVDASGTEVDPGRWTQDFAMLLRTAAEFADVDRIFVNPAIKRELCRSVDGDRAWLGKIRPWWGHDHHFHVGLRCAASDPRCENRQPPVPSGDGCDETLAWWFSAEARAAAATSSPRPPITLDDLPPDCRSLLGS